MEIDKAITFFNRVTINKNFLDTLEKYISRGYEMNLDNDGNIVGVKGSTIITIESKTGEVHESTRQTTEEGDSKDQGGKGTKKRRQVEKGRKKDL